MGADLAVGAGAGVDVQESDRMGVSRRGRASRADAHPEKSGRGPAGTRVAAGKRSLNLVLDCELVYRLKALALLRRCTVSDLVAEWAAEQTRGLVLAVRRPGESGERVNPEESEAGGPGAAASGRPGGPAGLGE